MQVYLESDPHDRLEIHNKISSHICSSSASLYVPGFSYWSGKKLYKCMYCNKKIPIRARDYHKGSEPNNKDEHYSIYCPQCDEYYTWEPHYDGFDQIIMCNKRNAVCIGPYFRGYQEHYKNDTGKTDELRDPDYIIPNPPTCLPRKQLGQYIREQIIILTEKKG